MSDILSDIDEVLYVEETENTPESSEDEVVDGENDTSTDEVEDGSDEGKEGDAEDTDKDKEEKPKKENGVQKRINELTREKYEYRKRIEELERKLGENKPQLPEKPDPRQFRDERSYRDALVKYETTIEFIEKEREAEEQRTANERLQSVASKIQAEKSKFKDFESVVSSISHIQMDEALTDVLLNDKNGIDVLYFLGQNPGIAEEISTMSQTKQARTLGVISAKLEARKTGKLVSGAPKPPSKVAGSAKKEKHPGEMSPEEYAKWRSKQK